MIRAMLQSLINKSKPNMYNKNIKSNKNSYYTLYFCSSLPWSKASEYIRVWANLRDIACVAVSGSRTKKNPTLTWSQVEIMRSDL